MCMFHDNLASIREITQKDHSHLDSLNNALKVIEGGGSWLSHLSHLTRALVIYNNDLKAAALVLMAYFDNYNMCFDKNSLVKTITTISKDNVLDIPKITSMIKNVMQ